MKTLKVSLVATVAALLAWWLRLPHHLWPAHPYVADVFVCLMLSLVLQLAWSDRRQ